MAVFVSRNESSDRLLEESRLNKRNYRAYMLALNKIAIELRQQGIALSTEMLDAEKAKFPAEFWEEEVLLKKGDSVTTEHEKKEANKGLDFMLGVLGLIGLFIQLLRKGDTEIDWPVFIIGFVVSSVVIGLLTAGI